MSIRLPVTSVYKWLSFMLLMNIYSLQQLTFELLKYFVVHIYEKTIIIKADHEYPLH